MPKRPLPRPWLSMLKGASENIVDEFHESAGAVAEAGLAAHEAVLGGGRHFAKGDVETVGHEDRVKAVAHVAARRPDKRALDLADIKLVAAIGMGKAEGGVEG